MLFRFDTTKKVRVFFTGRLFLCIRILYALEQVLDGFVQTVIPRFRTSKKELAVGCLSSLVHSSVTPA